MEISQIGPIVCEGKTKRVHQLNDDNDTLVLVVSKDRITAGDGLKAHEMEGKSILSTQTNCALFEFLASVGVRTHYVSRVSSTYGDAQRAFVAKKCAMIPIEWVSRRVATGSYVRRNPNVEEGYRFAPLKLETFYKDDANHDPFWSLESIIGAKMVSNGLLITETEVKEMTEITLLVFELIERVWQTANHSLIDMKIEFGVTSDMRIVVADVIDNDSWRLWPNGDKALMLDKQVYRNMEARDIDEAAIARVRSNFEIVAERTQRLFGSVVSGGGGGERARVAIVLGSLSDREHAHKIVKCLGEKYGISDVQIEVTSAHKSTHKTLDVCARLVQWPQLKVIIACAGMSNGLGPVMAANASVPVLNSPPTVSLDALSLDVWSSLRMPSGVGCATVIGAENVALAAAQIAGTSDVFVWSRVRTQQTNTSIRLLYSNYN